MLPRYRSDDDDLNYWPAVADSFVGVLAVVVFLVSGIMPADKEVVSFQKVLASKFERERSAGLLRDFEITASKAKITYSAESLSFETCDWDINPNKAEMLRNHLRWFGEKKGLIHLIRIEGHADSRPLRNCGPIEPYTDNLQLSQNRARAVYNVFLGLEPKQVKGLDDYLAVENMRPPKGLEFIAELNRTGKLLTAGYGATRPITLDPMDPINRRVEIVIEFRESRLFQPATE